MTNTLTTGPRKLSRCFFLKMLLIAFFVTCLSKQPSFAQITLTDSLKNQLAQTNVDTNRVKLLSELCLQFRLSKPDLAMWYGQQALNLARRLNYTKGEADALGNIGFVMREISNLPSALKTEFKAYQLAEANGHVHEMGRILNIIGNIYLDLKDYPNALTYYNRAIQKHILANNQIGFAITESNIGSVYEQMNKLDSAWAYEYRSYQKITKLGLVNNLPYVLRILGNIQAKRGNIDQAMLYYRQSHQVALKENNLRNLAFADAAIARLFLKMNQRDSSIQYAQRSLHESQQGTYLRGVLTASTLLSEAYEPTNLGESLTYYKLAAATKDRLYGTENLQALRSIQFEEQEHQRELDVAKMAYQQQIKQYILLISLIILVVVALFLWRNNLQKQRANALLIQQRVKIGQQSNQLALLMQELHHRVKNNFAIVASLLKLQSVRLNDEKAIQVIQASQQRIEAMSLIHQRLYQSDLVTSVNMDEYLTELAMSLMRAYGYTLNQFDLQISIGPKTLDVDTAMPLGMIANELMTNAFKHAYTNVASPTLRVRLYKQLRNVVLEISDNGPGISAETWESYSKESSFGKLLITSLSSQLQARIHIRQKQGTLFRIVVPLYVKNDVTPNGSAYATSKEN